MTFSKSTEILAVAATDKTIKFWKLDERFDKVLNPVFYHTQTIKEFNHHIVDDPFWISSICMKETTNLELYAGDTQGYIHVFLYNPKGGQIRQKNGSI